MAAVGPRHCGTSFALRGSVSTMLDSADICCNALLNTLAATVVNRLSPYLERVRLLREQTLHAPDLCQHHVYFPIDCIVSLQAMLRNGASDEIAIVGNEGVVGLALILGDDHPPTRAVVRRAGNVWRLSIDCMRLEFQRSGGVQVELLRYSQALLAQIAQTAVCNRHHTLDQQLCRWLLMTLDRLPARELTLTREQIAHMLGVRREGVTEAAGRLQRAGIIQYSRGRIDVLERRKLEEAACECYPVVRHECSRLAKRVGVPPQRCHVESRHRSWPVRTTARAEA